MRLIRAIVILGLLVALAACGEKSKFLSYDGPEVTRVLILKDQRRMYLLHNEEVLADYDIGLGFAPDGHKEYEGDGRTPEGHYLIDKRNPNSAYHLSIGIDYPRPADVARAAAMGKSPGGDIFIHGRGPRYLKGSPNDWTAGCIAVTDREMEKIYAMIRNGTPIAIFPSEKHMLADRQARALAARKAADEAAAALEAVDAAQAGESAVAAPVQMAPAPALPAETSPAG